MYDVTTVGIMVADVIVKPVSALPEPGKLSNVSSIELHSGGNAMTAAINIARLGLRTAMAGRVGSDALGSFLMDRLEKNGVAAQSVKVDPDAGTSASAVMVSATGERSFLHCKGANACFDIKDIDMEVIGESRLVFVTGAYLLDRFDGAQMTEFLKQCREMGKITALDVCWNENGNWDIINSALPYVDIFMPSIDEAREIAHMETPEDIARVLLGMGVGCAVIKCGDKGCYVMEQGGKGEMKPAYANIEVADTTGAGDSFCSGFLAAYLYGEPILRCAEIANAVGACSVMMPGATEGVRSYAETLEFMEERNGHC